MGINFLKNYINVEFLVIILTVSLMIVLVLPEKNYQKTKNPSVIALGSSIGVFVITLFIFKDFFSVVNSDAYLSYTSQFYVFKKTLVGLDSLSIYFVLLTTFLFPICIVASWKNPLTHTRAFLVSLIAIEIILILVFTVNDLFLFYILYESILIPIFIIVGVWGSRLRKTRAAYFFFFYTLFGSLLILAAILYISSVYETTNFTLLTHSTTFISNPESHKFLFLAFFIAFAVKVPIIPFHIWLPETHVEAPAVGSALLAGILLKLGVFGIIKYAITLFPAASIEFSPFATSLGAIGVIYASFTAIRQTDLKRIIAYTSIAHINLNVIGIFSFTTVGLVGSIIQAISHGLVSTGLFLLIGSLYDRHGSRILIHYGGLCHVIPVFSIAFIAFSLANIGLPLTSAFVSEICLFAAIFTNDPIICGIVLFSIVLSAAYSLWLANRILFGNLKTEYIKKYQDLASNEECAFGILVTLVLSLGILPIEFISSFIHYPDYLLSRFSYYGALNNIDPFNFFKSK
jgi:proton-translocating NADH-quinone oxidoreductase chain M